MRRRPRPVRQRGPGGRGGLGARRRRRPGRIRVPRDRGGPDAGRAGTAASGRRLALAVRAALRAGSGLDYADYIAGGDGLDVRDDLAGLNLSTRPTVLVECGNLHNPADAALLSSPAGRQRVATALATGILDFLRS